VTAPIDVSAAGRDLVASLITTPSGQLSPSVYETGRLVSLAPGFPGHVRRLEFLLNTQASTGAWGPGDGYALVPTLSATEALLTTLRRRDAAAGLSRVADAVHRSMRYLVGSLGDGEALVLPGTPAIEIILPSLVESVNQHVVGAGSTTPSAHWGPLHMPAGLTLEPLAMLRSRLESGAGIDTKLLHALEAAGRAALRSRAVYPTSSGTVGGSPAATAAWLGADGMREADRSSATYLAIAARSGGGPVPCTIPVTVFERAWVLGTLARAGIRVHVPREITTSLEKALGDVGTPTCPGLPPDADTTAVTLFALQSMGSRPDFGCLWAYETPTHFCTWPGEQGESTTVNAHVLEAFGEANEDRRGSNRRYLTAIDKTSSWLREQQRTDGAWNDRWHASAYYATASCALALHRFGGRESAAAVRRAVDWVVETQREDGSWGRWNGTAEESAYAIQILLATGPWPDIEIHNAAARGYVYLSNSAHRLDETPLWQDKDLYHPHAIVQAAVLAALHLAQRRPSTARRPVSVM
jgi:Squalene-hopene cyclase C-terminal domain